MFTSLQMEYDSLQYMEILSAPVGEFSLFLSTLSSKDAPRHMFVCHGIVVKLILLEYMLFLLKGIPTNI